MPYSGPDDEPPFLAQLPHCHPLQRLALLMDTSWPLLRSLTMHTPTTLRLQSLPAATTCAQTHHPYCPQAPPPFLSCRPEATPRGSSARLKTPSMPWCCCRCSPPPAGTRFMFEDASTLSGSSCRHNACAEPSTPKLAQCVSERHQPKHQKSGFA